MLTDEQVKKLELDANEIRENIVKMLVAAGSGHSAGPLGMADVFAAMYLGGVVRNNPSDPWNENRDRVILSNAHICPVWYATLAQAGYFHKDELSTLRKLGTRLQGHPHYRALPGVENSGGPLGQGLSQAIGQALAIKMDKTGMGERMPWVYCLLGDGELDEGQNWEAIQFAGHYKLHNLTAVVDRNSIQIDGFTETVMKLEPLADKWRAFNWTVIEVDGHNVREIVAAFEKARSIFEQPTVIIAHTVPGKGVDFMDWDPAWHGKPPKVDEAVEALRQLRSLDGKIREE
jgi:transketolase